jgi:ADP-ribose pyrophosphatase YjhB (NUDIX family)
LENRDLAKLLDQVNPDVPLGPELHSAVLRLSPAATIEAVALRRNGGNVEVLLRKRGLQEAAYPGQYHCPGSFFRRGEGVPEVFARLSANESLGTVVSFRFVDVYCWMEERGWIVSFIYLLEVIYPLPGADWYPVEDLPRPMVAHHESVIIPKAVELFCRMSG